MIGTPGHSPDHVTYSIAAEKAIFSGDVLFQGSVGRTDLPGADHQTLMRLDRDAAGHAARTRPACCPGHMDPTTLGTERAEQPVPARARAPVSRRSRRRAARTTCCPTLADERARLEQTAAKILERAGYGRIETPTFEATQLFSRTVGEATDVVQKEMYTLPGRQRGQPDAAPGGHRAGRARLPRARHAQGAAAGEAVVPVAASSATSARRPAASGSSGRSGRRRSGRPTRRWTPS